MADITEEYGTDIAHNKDLLLAANGDLDLISGLENLRQALFHRLMTVPGSLIHRPEYGVGVQNFLNAPNSYSQRQILALKIQENFRRDERVEEVTGVSMDLQDDPYTVIINVKVKAKGYDEVVFPFIPFGAEAT